MKKRSIRTGILFALLTPVLLICAENPIYAATTQTADDTGEKPTGIRIPGYPSITIEADKKDVQMNLMNPEGNPCYFTFEIVLNDTDETIYTSKMVEP